jgi:hypothetical protein
MFFCSYLKITPVLFDKETRVLMSADVKDDACERLLHVVPAHQVTPGTPGPSLSDSSPRTR